MTETVDGTVHDTLTGEIILPPEPVNDNSDDELPDHLTKPPGLLGDVIDWIEKTARSPNRVLALGAAITVIGTLAGRRDAGPTYSGCALYVLCLGPSGCGKQHGLDQVKRLLTAAEAVDRVGPGEFMSSTSVVAHLKEMPLSLCPMDEFGSFLKRINSRKAAPHEQAISKMLRQSWGVPFSSIQTPRAAGYASCTLYAPAMSIYGVSTPEEFYSALSGGDLENGTLNRFLIMPTAKRGEKVRSPLNAFDVPDDLADGLKALYQRDRAFPAIRLEAESASPVTPVAVPWANAEVESLYENFEKDIDDLRDANPDSADCYARTVEMALRLATIVAVGRTPESPTVSKEDFVWGRDLAMWSSRKLARDASERVSDTPMGATWMKITARIRRSGGRVSHSDLSKHMKLSKKDMEAALGAMEDADLIRIESVTRADGKVGRQARFYRLAQNNRTAA